MDTTIQVQFQVFEETGKPFQFKNKEFQTTLGPGEAMVKIILSTICGSDIHIRKGTQMVKVPNSVSDKAAVPANCALATMVSAVSQTSVLPKKAVAQGGGLLGVYACGLHKEACVSQMFCLEVNENRFQLIEDFGAIPVDAKDAQKAIQPILDRTGDETDAVFDVTGIKELISQGLALLRPGGDYILAGLVHPDSEMENTAEQIIRKCIRIKGVHNYASWQIDESIAFLERNIGRFPFNELVSPPFKLKEIEEAVHKAQKQKWMRISVKP